MSDIVFTYTIVGVSENGNSMDVLYKAEGYEDMLMGMLLPPEGVDVDEYIRMNAPIQNWLDSKVRRVIPQVGLSGSGSSAVAPAPEVNPVSATIPVERVVL